jgi:hypothetical protein
MQCPSVEEFPDTSESEMPLNPTDKAWITLEIQNALKRKGWGRLTGFIKDWSGASAAIGILIFLATQWGGYIEFRTGTNLRLGNIDVRLGNIEARLASITASLALNKPQAKGELAQLMRQNLTQQKDSALGLKTVAALATEAAAKKLTDDPQQISDVGKDLASTPTLFKGKQSTDAWNALTGLLNYSSFLRATGYLPAEQPKLLSFSPIDYDFGGTGGAVLHGTLYSLGGMVPIAEAARAEHISNPKPILVSEGPKTVLIQATPGEGLSLDGHRLKNVIFVGMIIEYNGGPVILENVSFINCVFRLIQQPQCIDFSKSVFASAATTFTSGG